ncbi:hypothetical protein [Flavobacterium collinsii]|jgi:hypothetical protein|uniref:HNH nuclease domain-containing protein n=1 Tax=Flavobacterium collinsii TaxID=1114861 RepID=A0ABM8KQ48_9FLAO|nr:hypothetical protein [Flavobacterium collinsii]CAA9203278.1 hypothetical protein FLACOL7796_04677 [Flavobacterium collinsii]
MIKLQDHIDKPNPDSYLSVLAKNHWDYLNPRTKKTNDYARGALVHKCKSLYTNCDSASYIKAYANGSRKTAQRHKKFFMLLKKYNYKFLKQLIFCPPSDFNFLRTEILNILFESDIFIRKGRKISQTPFGALLSNNLFDYKKFRSSEYCVKMYLDMGFLLSSCPYCNDRTIEIVKKNVAIGTVPQNIAYFDLDHFYPKSQNPFFALSFYNLIPSCSICNSKEKLDKTFSTITHIHPYQTSFDDCYMFQFSSTALLGVDNYEILINKKTAYDFENITDFNLLNRYENRMEDVKTMIRHYQNYHRSIITNKERELFVKYFTDPNPGVMYKKLILKGDRSKLYRDVIKGIDVDNIIGLAD